MFRIMRIFTQSNLTFPPLAGIMEVESLLNQRPFGALQLQADETVRPWPCSKTIATGDIRMKINRFPLILLLLTCICSLALSGTGLGAQYTTKATSRPVEIRYTDIPADFSLFPRDDRDMAIVTISGSVMTRGFNAIEVQARQNGNPWVSRSRTLNYTAANGAPFSFEIEIAAGLFSYDFTLSVISSGGTPVHALEIRDMVSGDAYLVQGQSNAVAADYYNEDLGNLLQRKWIRSFGTASTNPIGCRERPRMAPGRR